MESERKEIAEQAFQAGILTAQSSKSDQRNENWLALTEMLSRIAYPRRGSKDETATLQDFAEEIQARWGVDDL